MGKQYNRIEKRKRRKAYIKRKKEKLKVTLATAKPKAVKKVAPKKKEAAAEAPAAS